MREIGRKTIAGLGDVVEIVADRTSGGTLRPSLATVASDGQPEALGRSYEDSK